MVAPTTSINFVPYFAPVLDRHVFSPERSLSPLPQLQQDKVPSYLSDNSDDMLAEHHVRKELLSSSLHVAIWLCSLLLIPTAGDEEDQEDSATSNNFESFNPSNNEDTIPKPQGHVGKPGNGGYSLQTVLKWDEADYKAVQVSAKLPTSWVPNDNSLQECLRELTKEHLDFSKAFNAQDPGVIATLCDQVPLFKTGSIIIKATISFIYL